MSSFKTLVSLNLLVAVSIGVLVKEATASVNLGFATGLGFWVLALTILLCGEEIANLLKKR